MSAEIKNSIGLLCKLLNVIYKTNLKPEYFRLAKFNKSDENVVPILWNLLIKILGEDNLIMVKRKLHDLSYKRKEFYSCIEGNAQSRELLLAVGFLITNYLENDISKELNDSVFSENYEPFEHQQLLSCMTNQHQQFNWQKLSNNDLENYKMWICGKIGLNKNTVAEYKEYIFNMQEKYNNGLDIKADGNLSVYEILALKNKTIGEQFILDTDPLINLLSIYTEWLKKEKYFWKWMESVLLLEDKIKFGSSVVTY